MGQQQFAWLGVYEIDWVTGTIRQCEGVLGNPAASEADRVHAASRLMKLRSGLDERIASLFHPVPDTDSTPAMRPSAMNIPLPLTAAASS